MIYTDTCMLCIYVIIHDMMLVYVCNKKVNLPRAQSLRPLLMGKISAKTQTEDL